MWHRRISLAEMYPKSLLAFIFLDLFVFSYARPPFSSTDVSSRDKYLHARQSSCSCSPGPCNECSGKCCSSTTECAKYDSSFTIVDFREACCTGGTCSDTSAQPSSSSPSPSPTLTSSTPATPSPSTSATPSPSTSATSSTSTSATSSTSTSATPSPSASASASASSEQSKPSAATSNPPSSATPAAAASPSSKPKTGAIVGGAVSGTAAVGGVGAAIAAWITAQNGSYVLASLAAALFGLFLFKSRRMVFRVDPDIGPTQISLFLTSQKTLSDTKTDAPQKLLVWKVFDIGHSNRQFEVTVPCVYREGALKLGFGTIEDEGSRIKCVNFAQGSAYLDQDGNWNAEDEEQNEGKPKAGKPKRPGPLARNDSETASRVAIGTIDDSGDSMDPFLLVENSEFEHGSSYHATGDLYLHVFRSVGYAAGKYKDTIVKDIEGDRLTPVEGIKVKSLRPLTSWRIRSAGKNTGKLKLEITTNRKEDVKKYNHDCKIKKDAKEKGGDS